ncbi:MAG: BamA/TamA family outer membrane protein [Bacteroidetes bacterium]|nr:BamA/TamA family outer membrane protein [Bacteroidota bacterium]
MAFKISISVALKPFSLLILFTAFSSYVFGQEADSSNQLPFHISHLKKLDSLELVNKREGTFVTGIPDISSDPINGFGYGAEGSITFNGKKSDPFFNYTPYLTKIDVTLFNTSRNQREFKVAIDKPYIFKTKWRLRGEAAYEINPNLLYFGITGQTLNPLSKLSQSNQIPLPVYPSDDYSGYANSLNGPYKQYNTYTKEEYILNISGEYSLLDSRMRVLAGAELAHLNITPVNDSLARIETDKNNKNLLGVGKSTITILQLGVVYDTRDFEPDPSRGIFTEFTNEFSSKALGSNYNMDKVFAQFKWYRKLFPKTFKKMVFASRFGMGYTFGQAPFFEYQDEWSSEGSIEGLGGANTLRGYKQSRFLDRGMYFFNAELRTRFAGFKFLQQDIALSGVPFFDAGSVFNKFQDNFQSNRIRYSEGVGLRVAWNLSTILRFDYAISKEDHQFFFVFQQAF